MGPHSPVTRWLFASALAVTLVVDTLRVRSEALNRFFFRWCGVLLSPREARRLSLTWFLLGVFAVLWVPGEMVPVAAILVLALADPVAAVVGHHLGTRALGKGTVEGATAFFLTAALVLVPFVGLRVAVPVAVTVAVVEVLPSRVDDNALIPIATAMCLWALA
jgi:dolichol kinase